MHSGLQGPLLWKVQSSQASFGKIHWFLQQILFEVCRMKVPVTPSIWCMFWCGGANDRHLLRYMLPNNEEQFWGLGIGTGEWRYFGGEPEQAEGGVVARDEPVETINHFQQLAQGAAGPAPRLLGLLMPPPVSAGLASTNMSQNAFKTRGHTVSKLQEPTAKLRSTTA